MHEHVIYMYLVIVAVLIRVHVNGVLINRVFVVVLFELSIDMVT